MADRAASAGWWKLRSVLLRSWSDFEGRLTLELSERSLVGRVTPVGAPARRAWQSGPSANTSR